jgi:hypothetical protein
LKFLKIKILYIYVLEEKREVDMETTDLSDMKFIGRKDKRMRFNNAKDPIFYAFNVLDERSLGDLMRDFVNDTMFEVSNFVSKLRG